MRVWSCERVWFAGECCECGGDFVDAGSDVCRVAVAEKLPSTWGVASFGVGLEIGHQGGGHGLPAGCPHLLHPLGVLPRQDGESYALTVAIAW
jgi:hypothetical protein